MAGRGSRRRVAAAAGDVVRPERIVLACSHTHSRARVGRVVQPVRDVRVPVVGRGTRERASAGRSVRPPACSARAGWRTARRPSPGWGIHRRIQTSRGVLLSHPPPPEEIVLSRGGPVDDSVNVLVARDLRDEAHVIATVVNATCHPVHEMCIPRVSADYPGVVSAALEAAHPGSVALFLNGAAGNINPTTVSAGADASRRHGVALAAAVERLLTAGNGLTPCDGIGVRAAGGHIADPPAERTAGGARAACRARGAARRAGQLRVPPRRAVRRDGPGTPRPLAVRR